MSIRDLSNWKYSRPVKYYPKALKLFGKPTFKANVEGGMVRWSNGSKATTKGNRNRKLYDEHLLIDEDVLHCVPKPHHDFFYSSIKFYIPTTRRLDVLSISGSINYDGLKKTITARCGGIGANIATLYLGMKVALGHISINEVKRAGLYSKHIRGEAKTYFEMEQEMIEMKDMNNRVYKDLLKEERDPLAFSKC